MKINSFLYYIRILKTNFYLGLNTGHLLLQECKRKFRSQIAATT